MKPWMKFILYLVTGLSGFGSISVGTLFLIDPNSIQSYVFAGTVCLICGTVSVFWGLLNGMNLKHW